MKYWLRLFLLVGAIVSIFSAIGYFMPHGYNFSTETDIAASPQTVYARIDSLPKWKTWSQWNPDKVESLQIEYGADGTSQTWSDVRGSGKLWFTEQIQDKQISYKLRFANFPEMDSTILLEPDGEKTKVTWSSEGVLPSSPFYGFFRHIYVDGMKTQYLQSLELLKSDIENGAPAGPDGSKRENN